MSQPQKGAKGRAAAASLSATAKKDAGERFFEAVDELMHTIRAKASREVQQDSQRFRRECCYIEATDAALRTHEAALRLLFLKVSPDCF